MVFCHKMPPSKPHVHVLSYEWPDPAPIFFKAVRGARAPVRVVGRGHSFTPVAECKGGTLLSLARLNRVIDFQAPTANKIGSITIEGGVTYTEVIQHLGERGRALSEDPDRLSRYVHVGSSSPCRRLSVLASRS